MSPLERDQADFAARLNAEAYFADIGIYVLRPRENLSTTAIIQGIEAALNCLKTKNGKGGAAVTVLMPVISSPEGGAPGPYLDERITVRVQELPLVNLGALGTMKSAETIALEIIGLFHLWQIGANVWYADTDAAVPNTDFEPKVTYDVTFRRRLTIQAATRAATPMLTLGEDLVSVVITAEPGAIIYVTTDGSYPSALNEAAFIYSAPLSPSLPATLRAVAYVEDKQPSSVATITLRTPADFNEDFFNDFAT